MAGRLCARLVACTAVVAPACVSSAHAAQIDIHGPSDSVNFGGRQTFLANGNIVVVDSSWNASTFGAVYLYSPQGTLISYFTGASPNDRIGSGGIAKLSNGDFIVLSPYWSNGAQAEAGAVTWVDGTTGLSGVVSTSNSIYGTAAHDHVGSGGLASVRDNNYVIVSADWNGGAGAVTWVDGNASAHFAVASANSLVGSLATDMVGSGGIATIGGGNYLVKSPHWNGERGAATWASGASGISGAVGISNSLVGVLAGDHVGADARSVDNNSNIVVLSPDFSSGRGAATWMNGATGTTGILNGAISLLGNAVGDHVGSGGILSSSGAKYIVASPQWNGGRGAATLLDGSVGTSAVVTASNSLIGATPGDAVPKSMIGVSGGNFVVAAPAWNGNRGAVTWINGTTGLIDTVSAANSLVGTNAGDRVGTLLTGVFGNYVTASQTWNGGMGAATFAHGATGITGLVSTLNSLVGNAAGDQTGSGITVLPNGNYVVASFGWNGYRGAATWVSGTAGFVGTVSAANSLVGAAAGDRTGVYVTGVGTGNFAVASPDWNGGRGAVTWVNGAGTHTGVVSAANSLVGTDTADHLADGGLSHESDGAYSFYSLHWNGGRGALTYASGTFALVGTVQPWNSVESGVPGAAMYGGGYDATRHRWLIGRPAESIVSIFTLEQIFAASFE